jgi:formate dehydrogenase major subunit
MKLDRRGFLKFTAATTAAAAFGGLGFDMKLSEARAAELESNIKEAKETTSVCCYCGVGCGLLVHTDKKTKRAINIEGDPDHPINEGALCAKGASTWQLVENDQRPTKPLYRAPGSDKWEEKTWDWMLEQIAQRIYKTREETIVLKNEKGQVVNRAEGLASIGSAAMDNEECWVYQAMLRSLGLFSIEHQARI